MDVWRMCVVVCGCFVEEARSVAMLEKVSVKKRAVKARSYLREPAIKCEASSD